MVKTLNPQDPEQVLCSFWEWMVQQPYAAKSINQTAQKASSDPDNHVSWKESNFSPSIASKEPSISSASPERSIDQLANIPAAASNRPSVGRRVFRTVVPSFLVVIVVAGVWQVYRDDQTRTLIKAWGHLSLTWLSSILGTAEHHSGSAAEASAKLSDQAASTRAVASIPTKEFTELQQQLQIIVGDLAVLRRSVEQLSSKQEQMSQDIVSLQATEQKVSEKMSSLPQAASAPRKNASPSSLSPR